MQRLENGYYYDTRNHRVYKYDLPEQLRNNNDEFHKDWKDCTSITKKRHARRIVLLLTNSCNLACSYCYAAQGGYGKDCINKITRNQIMQILRFLERQFSDGIDQIQFFGGEPLLEPKAMEFISDYLDSSSLFKDTAKTMVTNGTVVNNAIVRMLRKHNILVTVSVDGTKKYHDLFRTFKVNGKGSYNLVVNNIRKLKSSGVEVFIEFTISKQMAVDYGQGLLNPEEIAENFERLGISFVHLAPVIDVRNGMYAFDGRHRALLLQLQRDLMDALHKHNIQDNSTAGAYTFLTQKRCNNRYCGAGLDEITIDINGDIYPCFMFVNKKDFLLGNVMDGITNTGFLEELEMNTKDRNRSCGICPIKDSCNMCIGANYVENGDIHKSSRTECGFQRNGYFRGIEHLVQGISNE